MRDRKPPIELKVKQRVWKHHQAWKYQLKTQEQKRKLRAVMGLSRTSSWEVPATPWAQGGPRSDTRDLWCHRWGGIADWPHPKRNGTASISIGPTWGHSCYICFRLLQCCSSNTMINSRLDFHLWKSTSNHWLLFKGRVLNACVGGLVTHLWAWRFRILGANQFACVECKGLMLVTLAKIEKRSR